jgi:hypothetical protein
VHWNGRFREGAHLHIKSSSINALLLIIFSLNFPCIVSIHSATFVREHALQFESRSCTSHPNRCFTYSVGVPNVLSRGISLFVSRYTYFPLWTQHPASQPNQTRKRHFQTLRGKLRGAMTKAESLRMGILEKTEERMALSCVGDCDRLGFWRDLGGLCVRRDEVGGFWKGAPVVLHVAVNQCFPA